MRHLRPNKGWRPTTVKHTVPLVGRDKAVEWEGPVSPTAAGKHLFPLPCFPGRESTVLSRKVTRASACPVGSTYREERRTCCDNDAHLSHQLVPTWPRVAVGGGPPSPSFPEQARRPTSLGSRGTTAPLIRAHQGHGIQQRKYSDATARPIDPDARFRFIGWETGALAGYCNAPLPLPCSVLPLDAPISAQRTTSPCARLEKA